MRSRKSLGRRFGWLWAAYAVSAFGTSLAFDAFSLIAIQVLHAGPREVSGLAAAGLAVGALVAVPLGPWIEFRRKRPVMMTMDLLRFVMLLSVPAAYALGWLGFAQLLVVSVIVGAADITFTAASGAYLKALVRREDLLPTNGRFEATTWTTTMLGPPLGGVAIGLLGPVVTVLANAASFLLSAAGIRAIGGREPSPALIGGPESSPAPIARQGNSPTPTSKQRPSPAPASGRKASPAPTAMAGGGREARLVPTGQRRLRVADLLEGWRYILTHRGLRPLFFNVILVNGLIMAAQPLMALLMLGQLGFTPWQYGLAFAAPCVGGLVGSRMAPRLVARFGSHRIMRIVGGLRACWPIGLVFVHPGVGGLVLVMAVELAVITCFGVFNPVLATYRLTQVPADRVARTLSAWSVASKASIAALTFLCGLLAGAIGSRPAIAVAGLVILGTPFLLPRHDRARHQERETPTAARR
ncbi:MFS transporter [Amycolatopsis sp. NBC_01480]|uniref:MFS transporter n=1 Tax=Amycolatopsis sp. NBC_01480 TaxID=2903562 RepID=UPI002E2CB6C4|nr:MFS transporter [Amycolatopsis sp. NBC_01480]